MTLFPVNPKIFMKRHLRRSCTVPFARDAFSRPSVSSMLLLGPTGVGKTKKAASPMDSDEHFPTPLCSSWFDDDLAGELFTRCH
jgi:hypothetical protein